MPRDVAQENMIVTVEQIEIPVEGRAEAGGGLLLGRRPMREEHDQVDLPRKFAKQRRVILDRMRGENRKAHHLAWRRASRAASNTRANSPATRWAVNAAYAAGSARPSLSGAVARSTSALAKAGVRPDSSSTDANPSARPPPAAERMSWALLIE